METAHHNEGGTGKKRRAPAVVAGYDCEFVEPPQKQFQSECPVCLQILREPYINDCCGHSFCASCIERIEADSSRCPMCKAPAFTRIANKGLQRALNDFHVHCPHRELGCEWMGELGSLDRHLNLEPPFENQLEGCQLAVIACVYCGEGIRRDQLAAHTAERCPQRPYVCDYCTEYESTFEDVTLSHWSKCKCFPLPCPNGCSLSELGIQRQNLDHHVNEECPLSILQCELHYAGCDVSLPRKDMATHMSDNAVAHISLLASQNQWLTKQLQEKDKLNLQLAKEIELLRVVPATFKMSGFRELKKKGGAWHSPAFYTHSGGYKMSLRVDARGRGRGRGTHISVFVRLMRGEYDACLTWPFRGSVTYQLLNQLDEDNGHCTKTTVYDDSTSLHSAGRVIVGEQSGGWGKVKFISHSELGFNRAANRQYLKADSLVFRIVAVEVV